MNTTKVINFIIALAALFVSGNYAAAAIVVNITSNSPTDTVLTATISGSARLSTSPALNKWEDVEYESFEWRQLDRDSGVNIFAISGFNYYDSIPVSNSTAIAWTASDSITVTAVDLVTVGWEDRNDFGFHFNRNPNFLPNEVVNFSGSFEFSVGSFTAADFSSGTWSSFSGIYWVSDLEDQGLTLNLNVAPVPEPTTYAMALAGLACGGWMMRRRKSAGGPGRSSLS